jgi:hypothetical protein
MRCFPYECEKYGIISYRLPTIPETTKLMNYLKQFQDSKDDLGAITWFVDNIAPYIVEVKLKFEDSEINSYEELMEYPEFLQSLIAVSNLIMQKSLSFKGESGDKKKR